MEDATKLRAWWSERQWLNDRSSAGTQHDCPTAILKDTGWARSVGGSGPYLTLWARGRLRREAVDAAEARMEIYELPCARGCTYIVPADHFRLALTLGVVSSDAERKVGAKLGVNDAELDRLTSAVKDAIRQKPLAPDELRSSIGGASRNLGPEGVKKGISTTLPLALGMLQSAGEIRRVPMNGRLDQQRYRYVCWEPNPIGAKMPLDEAYFELARLYFGWIGPATLAEFQWFSGLCVKAAKAALDPLGLVEIEGRILHACDVDEFRRFQAPKGPAYRLVSTLDGIALLRRDIKSLLAPEDLTRLIVDDRGKTTTIGNALEVVMQETEAYIREDLGDARSVSLDSPKSRAPGIDFLREAVQA